MLQPQRLVRRGLSRLIVPHGARRRTALALAQPLAHVGREAARDGVTDDEHTPPVEAATRVGRAAAAARIPRHPRVPAVRAARVAAGGALETQLGAVGRQYPAPRQLRPRRLPKRRAPHTASVVAAGTHRAGARPLDVQRPVDVARDALDHLALAAAARGARHGLHLLRLQLGVASLGLARRRIFRTLVRRVVRGASPRAVAKGGDVVRCKAGFLIPIIFEIRRVC
mmetsp:Transcript_41074/g.68244  ORF Transcript_41074/g.68244 Transcript_41074/m.68244 type:complete len:226 (+) Transcript_41074:805-1482(+)